MADQTTPCASCAQRGHLTACPICAAKAVEQADLAVRFTTFVPKKVRQQDKNLD